MLIGLNYSNYEIFDFASRHTPCFFIDCANIANPHIIKNEYVDWNNLYVLEIELIYVFRDVIKNLKKISPEKKVIITNFGGLFHYQNEEENKEILRHSFELLKKQSKEFDIYIGIREEEETLGKYCDEIRMGHTVWSQRIVIDQLSHELHTYAKALNKEDREVFEEIMKKPLKHLGSISYANSMHAWAFLIISILVEQKKDDNRRLQSR